MFNRLFRSTTGCQCRHFKLLGNQTSGHEITSNKMHTLLLTVWCLRFADVVDQILDITGRTIGASPWLMLNDHGLAFLIRTST